MTFRHSSSKTYFYLITFNIKSDVCDQPSAFFGGDFSRSFSSDLDFSGDFDFRTAFFSLNAVLQGENFNKFSKLVTLNCFMGGWLT